ncbi:MAG: hypothetical protein ABJC04_04705 [Verrucomicrobiota bacterium]
MTTLIPYLKSNVFPGKTSKNIPVATSFSSDYSVNMNTKSKLLRLVVSATFGSLLWAGCASPNHDHHMSMAPTSSPTDMTRVRANTHPEYRLGLNAGPNQVIDITLEGNEIVEAAGAQRLLY